MGGSVDEQTYGHMISRMDRLLNFLRNGAYACVGSATSYYSGRCTGFR